MTRGELLKRLFASHANPAEFERAAHALIAEEETRNNRVLANSLRKALQSAKPNGFSQGETTLSALPKEKDKGVALAEISTSRKSPRDIILSQENNSLFERALTEYRQRDILQKHGLPVSSKFLFVGPPGCGKTLCAEIFSAQIGLPLVVVRFDALVSSFLGETSTNLRKVFEYSEHNPVVLFLDEFDAVARSRSDDSEHGELRRVVNSLLQLIDRHSGNGFVIAATNHESQLDSAIWRRFDEVVFFDAPEEREIGLMLRLKLKNFPVSFELKSKAKSLVGFTYAEIERICFNAIKTALLKREKSVSEDFLDASVRLENRRRQVALKVSRNP